jgi:DNA (cytosine-5)-methyltransferase 1
MEGTKLNVKTAASFLNLTVQQVRNLCRSGKIPSQRFGRSWVIENEDLQKYYDNNSCGLTIDKSYSSGNADPLAFRKPIALSFFSGAMGMDIGIEKAGFEVLLACEVDAACRKTILKNKPGIALIGDIRDYTSKKIRKAAGLSPKQEIDLIVGGPPCQAFSTAGKRKGFEDDRGNLFLTFLDRIIELKPRFAVIENVRGLLSAPLKHRPHDKRDKKNSPLLIEEMRGGALMHITKVLKKAGYGVSFTLYNAANFGVPQKRERVIIIASRDGQKAPYLIPTHSQFGENNLPKWNTFLQATRDLPNSNHHHLNFPEKRLKYYRMLNPGEYWKHLPTRYQKQALGNAFYSGGGKTGFLRRLSWDLPSPTLVTHPAMPATDLAHPIENRTLSIEEYKRLQQFPDNWKIEGSLIEQYKQIGNAVPVGLGKALGDLLLKILNNQNIPNNSEFKYSRYINTTEVTWEKDIRSQYKKAS